MIGTEAGVELESLEVQGDPLRYLVEFDRDAVAPSAAVVAAVATVTDADPTAMAPLFDTLDPDALDAVLASGASQGRAVSVSFDLEGHELEVSGDGVVAIDPPESASVHDCAEQGVVR